MTDLELLRKLIRSKNGDNAPAQSMYVGKWYEFVIDIHSEHVAYIRIDDDSHKALFGPVPNRSDMEAV